MDYKKVIEDFNNGEIDRDYVTLVMDNDGGYWCCDTGDEEYDEMIQNDLKDMYGEPGGYRDIVDVLEAAGVNVEWC